MHYAVNSKDKIGDLIRQLRVIQDDLSFLITAGKKVKMTDYPNLEETANLALLNGYGDLDNRACTRVEKAGFWLWKRDGALHFNTTAGVVRVPIKPRRLMGEEKDWRENLKENQLS